jgi:uncharacterized protein (TIGR02001 family)
LVSVYSQDMFRGYSLSAGRPVGIIDLSYDDPSGAYAALSASAMTGPDGPRPLKLQLGGGYARRLRSGLTLDVGAVASRYAGYANTKGGRSYAELYAGVAGKLISSRLYLSPHYFGPHTRTVYGEVDGHVPLGSHFGLETHAGLLVPFNGYGQASRAQYDWRLGISRDIGRIALHAAWAGGGPGRDYYKGEEHRRSALIVGASLVL